MAKTYTPVGWEDGKIISPAIADLITGEVTPAQVSGTTPVNADNLRHMDDAIKDLYDEGTTSKDIVIGTEEETTEDTKLLIETDSLASLGTEIESGTNENGDYIKYADGTLIQTGSTSITSESTSRTSGGITFYSGQSEITYPIDFYDTNIKGLVEVDGANQDIFFCHSFNRNSVATATITMQITKASYSRNVRWIAIGKWKTTS